MILVKSLLVYISWQISCLGECLEIEDPIGHSCITWLTTQQASSHKKGVAVCGIYRDLSIGRLKSGIQCQESIEPRRQCRYITHSTGGNPLTQLDI